MTLPPLITSLMHLEAYPEPHPEEVTLRQTHISYLLFTPEFVYKIKKPVDFGFLDFTTLEKREHFCKEEVRLNKRLAPEIYLGVVPITKEGDGYRMEGKGEPKEYAVKMKRLPETLMLDQMLKDDRVDPELIERAAEKIKAFHKEAKSSKDISKFGRIETIRRNAQENFAQTLPFIGRTITEETYDVIKDYTEEFLSSHTELFEERVREGYIKDCHGDIHSDHVSASDGISIFDCIEFNERFRYSDTIADMAFLSMDLEFRSRGDLARVFEKSYFSFYTDERGADEHGRYKDLLDFYKCYRAFVRGKVEGLRLIEPEETEKDKEEALARARLYFRLARGYATGGFRPVMVVVSGLSGTGKSTVALALKDITGMAILSTDLVRKELAEVPATEEHRAGYAQGIYSKEMTTKTYKSLIERAERLLTTGRSVIVDGTFSKKKFLKEAAEAAGRAGAEFCVVECLSDEETIRKRLGKRALDKEAVSDATYEIYKEQRLRFEGIEAPSLRLPTVEAPERLASTIIKEILS